MSHTFSKFERLSKRNDIKELFEKGSSFYLYPFTVKFLPKKEAEHSVILTTASKRYFKKAVDRNFIKRRIRESYRLNKSILTNHYHIGFIYNSKKLHDFELIERKLIKVLEQLQNEIY